MLDTKDIKESQNKNETIFEIKQETLSKEENINEKLSEKLEENSNGNNGRWGTNEHKRFLQGCLLYKNNWKKVETYVRTRTSTQIRSHAQKYLKKLEKKYCSKSSRNKSLNDSFNDELNDFVLIKKENNDNKNNHNEIIKENEKNENNNKEIEKNNENNENINTMKLEEFEDDKLKLSEDKIKQLVEDLNKENFDIKIVEKIIINIFRPNKKCEDITKQEYKKSIEKKNYVHSKSNKNIFLCQKLKREINYESKLKELLESNNQNDLIQLLKIYQERCLPEHDILINLIENN